MDTLDIALRLGAATLVGVGLGLNRDLHGKPTGVRTLGLVCLGSALAVLSIGAACAVAEWQIVVLGAALVFVILIFGGPFEKAIDRRWPGQNLTDPGQETRNTTRVPGSEM